MEAFYMEQFLKIRDCVAIYIIYYQVKKMYKIGGTR